MNRIAALIVVSGSLILANGCIAVGLGGKSEGIERRLNNLEDRVSRLESRGPHGMPPPPGMGGVDPFSQPTPPPGASDPFSPESEMRRRLEQLERENRMLREKSGKAD